ncbi:preprotein translocase, YajC subunit [Stackebrandtia nassauensis DSM 44728]|uniref:Preprotein translocase, YajC subunit n=2 Tax=Stackebrandtia TaxID=283810 RepID=D3PYP8_STANL|nr:preprotein translocase, YajC subunit [Stackebrandtia nassauensis DSM 44728]
MMPAVIILLMVAMYFFMIRPQNKKRREIMEKQRQAGPGQTIVTIGGLHATIIDADKDTVTLEVSPGVMCVYERGAIARVVDETVETDLTTDDDDSEDEKSEETPASAVVDMKADKSSGDDSRK